MDVQPLLNELGQRIREMRTAAGLNVSELARESGLSRRYVTETEAGRANPTIGKLAALAAALRVPLRELCDLGQATSSRTERIALLGLRGAGKSSIGRRLALALDAPFIELDRRVEELAGMPLGELFDLEGVETFRRLEREALERVLAEGGRQVIATSGSIVDSEETFERLRRACHTVWLRAEPEEHLARVLAQGDRRPVEGRPRALEELRGLLERREPMYAACDLTLVTSQRGQDELVEELAAAIEAGLL